MSVEIIVSFAAIVISILILTWLFKILKTSIKTMLSVAAILIVLQLAFGINSKQFAREILQIIAHLEQIVFN